MAEKQLQNGRLRSFGINSEERKSLNCDSGYESESHEEVVRTPIGAINTDTNTICYGYRSTQSGDITLWRALQDGDVNCHNGSMRENGAWVPRNRPLVPGECVIVEGIRVDALGEHKITQVWTYDSHIGKMHKVKRFPIEREVLGEDGDAKRDINGRVITETVNLSTFGEGEHVSGTLRPIKTGDFYHLVPLPDEYINSWVEIDGNLRAKSTIRLAAEEGKYGVWSESGSMEMPEPGHFCRNNGLVFSGNVKTNQAGVVERDKDGRMVIEEGEDVFRKLKPGQAFILDSASGRRLYRNDAGDLTESTEHIANIRESRAMAIYLPIPSHIYDSNYDVEEESRVREIHITAAFLTERLVIPTILDALGEAYTQILTEHTPADLPIPQQQATANRLGLIGAVKNSVSEAVGALVHNDKSRIVGAVDTLAKYIGNYETLGTRLFDKTARAMASTSDATPVTPSDRFRTLLAYGISAYNTRQGLGKFHVALGEEAKSLSHGVVAGGLSHLTAKIASHLILGDTIEKAVHPYADETLAAAMGLIAFIMASRYIHRHAGAKVIENEFKAGAARGEFHYGKPGWNPKYHLSSSDVVGFIKPIQKSFGQIRDGISGMLFAGTGGIESSRFFANSNIVTQSAKYIALGLTVSGVALGGSEYFGLTDFGFKTALTTTILGLAGGATSWPLSKITSGVLHEGEIIHKRNADFTSWGSRVNTVLTNVKLGPGFTEFR